MSGLDLALGVFTVLAFALAAYVFGGKLLGHVGGEMLAVAVIASGAASEVRTKLNQRRMLALSRNICPSCGAPITTEHRHRAWEPERNEWRKPQTSWDCGRCGFAHSEAWACPACATQE